MVTDATLSHAERSKTAVPLPADLADIAKSLLKSLLKSADMATGITTCMVVPSENVRVAVMLVASYAVYTSHCRASMRPLTGNAIPIVAGS